MNSMGMLIGGEERSSSARDEVTNPFNGAVIGEVALASAGDMDAAIASAHAAFRETRALPSHARRDILQRVAAALGERREEIARLMVAESGKPIQYARGEVDRAVLTLSLGADESRRLGGEVHPTDIAPSGEGRLCLHTRVPRGPVAAISPFNFPLNLVAHKLSPAAAVGASTVLKPPAQCPMTALTLGRIFQESGMPAGGINVVHCVPEVGERMVRDDRMKVLSFTGSDGLGWRLKGLAPRKKTLLELGGNAPAILAEDADWESHMDRLIMGAWAHAGQVCIKTQRIYVHRSRLEDFVGEFVEATRSVVTGDPMDEATMVGPLIEPHHVERVLGMVQEAVDQGARLLCGGEADGSVVQPTVLTDVTEDMRVVSEEVFGPVTTIAAFDEFDAVLDTCNSGRFGLHVGVFTRDIDRALHAFDRLDYGGVIINDVPTFRIDNFPYGGVKDSGEGREGVRWAVEEMTEPKVLVIRRRS